MDIIIISRPDDLLVLTDCYKGSREGYIEYI